MAEEGRDRKYEMALQGIKVPNVLLDPKWHQLFDGRKKPQKVKSLEAELNELMKRQGKLNNELKDLRRLKGKLMDEIVEYMDVIQKNPDNKQGKKKMDDNQQMIKEIKEKIDAEEEELMELPGKIRETNQELMIESMISCYGYIHKNSDDIFAIDEWVNKVRAELKKNLLIKQEREAKNLQIYKYMHNILGAQVLDIFDVKYLKGWKPPQDEQTEMAAEEKQTEKKE